MSTDITVLDKMQTSVEMLRLLAALVNPDSLVLETQERGQLWAVLHQLVQDIDAGMHVLSSSRCREEGGQA
jgi:hypothetical protein